MIKFFKTAWEKWKSIAQKIGNAQARLILAIFYFLIICPFALVVKFISKPLRLRVSHTSNWRRFEPESSDILARARRQF